MTVSVGYAPGGAGPLPSFEQARLWWYQWFQTLDAGAEAVGRDPIGFARRAVGHLEPGRLVRGGRVRRDRQGVPAP